MEEALSDAIFNIRNWIGSYKSYDPQPTLESVFAKWNPIYKPQIVKRAVLYLLDLKLAIMTDNGTIMLTGRK